MNWQDLANTVNSTPGHQLLTIEFENGDPIGIMRYQRSLIQRVAYHEDLFSIFLQWEAFFSPFDNQWIWGNPPNKNGECVQIIDLNVEKATPETNETSGISLVYHVIWRGLPNGFDVDPKTNAIRNQGTTLNFMETGKWIIPPSCKNMLLDLSSIKSE